MSTCCEDSRHSVVDLAIFEFHPIAITQHIFEVEALLIVTTPGTHRRPRAGKARIANNGRECPFLVIGPRAARDGVGQLHNVVGLGIDREVRQLILEGIEQILNCFPLRNASASLRTNGRPHALKAGDQSLYEAHDADADGAT